MELSLRREDFSTLAGWADDRPAAAFAAFRRSAGFATTRKAYRTGSLGLSPSDFEPAYAAALAQNVPESGYLYDLQARAFFGEFALHELLERELPPGAHRRLGPPVRGLLGACRHALKLARDLVVPLVQPR